MAASRFLDRLPPSRRAVVEPEIRRRIDKGDSLDKLLKWAESEGLEVSRATLGNYRREVLGGGAEDPAARVREAVKAAAAPAESERGDVGAIDHVELLRAQLRAAEQLATEEADPKDRIAAAKLVLQLSKELQEMERAGAAAQQLRTVFYFPEKVRIEMCEADEA